MPVSFREMLQSDSQFPDSGLLPPLRANAKYFTTERTNLGAVFLVARAEGAMDDSV